MGADELDTLELETFPDDDPLRGGDVDDSVESPEDDI